MTGYETKGGGLDEVEGSSVDSELQGAVEAALAQPTDMPDVGENAGLDEDVVLLSDVVQPPAPRKPAQEVEAKPVPAQPAETPATAVETNAGQEGPRAAKIPRAAILGTEPEAAEAPAAAPDDSDEAAILDDEEDFVPAPPASISRSEAVAAVRDGRSQARDGKAATQQPKEHAGPNPEQGDSGQQPPENPPTAEGAASEGEPEKSLLELALGYQIKELQTDEPHAYEERQALANSAMQKVDAMRTALVTAAKAAGLEITEEQIDNWKPEGAQLEAVRAQLRTERIRAQILDGVVESLTDKNATKGMRGQQLDALAAVHNFLEYGQPTTSEGGKGGYVDMPTGTGKTGTFVKLAQYMKSKEDPEDPIRVVVLTPTRAIQTQTIGEADKKADLRGFAKFAPDLPVGSYNADEKTLNGHMDTITNASFNQLVQRGEMPNYDVVIVDEVHTGLGASISESLMKYGRDKLVVGFTATPDYHDEKRTSHILSEEIFSLPLLTAINAGLLAPVQAELRRLELEFDEDDLPEDPREREAVVKWAYFRARFESVKEEIKEDVRNGRGVLVHCPTSTVGGETIEFAKYAAEQLRDEMIATKDQSYVGRVRAAAVGGSDQQTTDTNILLGGFNNGNVQVLTYVDVITMGADLPGADSIYDLDQSTSRVKNTQALGRVLRLRHDDDGQPVQAKAVQFQSPSLGERQYTYLKALEAESGVVTSSWGRQGNYERVMTTPRGYVPEIVSDVVAEEQIGSRTVEHDDGVVTQQEIEVERVPEPPVVPEVRPVGAEQSPASAPPEEHPMTRDQVYKWLGIGPKRLQKYLDQLPKGTELRTREDLEVLVEFFPELHVDDVPEAGFLSVREAEQRLGYSYRRGGGLRFENELRRYQIPLRRYRDTDGVVKNFVAVENLDLPF